MVRRCNWGTCKADCRYPERISGYKFVPFPNPKTKLDKCLRWIKACNRSEKQLNVDNINKNRVICSRHFVGSHGPSGLYPDPIPADGSAPTPSRSVRIRDRILMENGSDVDIQNNELIQNLMRLDQIVVPQDKPIDYISRRPVTFSNVVPTATRLLKNKFLEKWKEEWKEEYLSELQTSQGSPGETSTATGRDRLTAQCDHCGNSRADATASRPAADTSRHSNVALHHSNVVHQPNVAIRQQNSAPHQSEVVPCKHADAAQELSVMQSNPIVTLSHPVANPPILPQSQTFVSMGQSAVIGHNNGHPPFASQVEYVECKPVVDFSQSDMYQSHQADVGSILESIDRKPIDDLTQSEAHQCKATAASSQTEVSKTRPICVGIQPAISESSFDYTVSQPVGSAPSQPDAVSHQLNVFPSLAIKTEDLNETSNGITDMGVSPSNVSAPSLSFSSSTSQTETCGGQYTIDSNGSPVTNCEAVITETACRFSSTTVEETPNKKMKLTHTPLMTYTASRHAPFKHPLVHQLPMVTSQSIYQGPAVDRNPTSTASSMFKASQLAPFIKTKSTSSPTTTPNPMHKPPNVDTRMTSNSSSRASSTVTASQAAPYISTKRAFSPLKASRQAPYMNKRSGITPSTTTEAIQRSSCSDTGLASTSSTFQCEQASSTRPVSIESTNRRDLYQEKSSVCKYQTTVNAMQPASDPDTFSLSSTTAGSTNQTSCTDTIPASSVLSTAIDRKKVESPKVNLKLNSMSHERMARCRPDFETFKKYLDFKLHTFIKTYGSSGKLTDIYRQYLKVTLLFCVTVANEVDSAEMKATSTVSQTPSTGETVPILQNANSKTTVPISEHLQTNANWSFPAQTLLLKNVAPTILLNPEALVCHTDVPLPPIGDNEKEGKSTDNGHEEQIKTAVVIKQERLDGDFEIIENFKDTEDVDSMKQEPTDDISQALERSGQSFETMKQATAHFSANGNVQQSEKYPLGGKVKQEPIEPELNAINTTQNVDKDAKMQTAREYIREGIECPESTETADKIKQEAGDASCEHIEHNIQILETMRPPAIDSSVEAESDHQSDIRQELVERELTADTSKRTEMDYHYVYEPLDYSEQKATAHRLKLEVLDDSVNEAMEYSNDSLDRDTVSQEPMNITNIAVQTFEHAVDVGKVKQKTVGEEPVKQSELYVIETIGHSEEVTCLETIKLEEEDYS